MQFAAIGKLVWSFTVLEHELARAAMKLRFQVAVEKSTGPIDDHIANIAGGTLGSRFKEFIAAIKASHQDKVTKAWIDEAVAKFPDGNIWRNRVCHGNWKRWDDGRLAVRFFDRNSLRDEVDVPYEPVSLDELRMMTDANLHWATEVAIRAGTAK